VNRLAFGGYAERLGESQPRVERDCARKIVAKEDHLRLAEGQHDATVLSQGGTVRISGSRRLPLRFG
jgi:hypothetical protein